MKLRPTRPLLNADEPFLDEDRRDCCQCAITRDADAEWRSFCEVLAEAIDCAVDLAITKVMEEADDVAALEHLRAIALTRLAGTPVPMRLSQMLAAIGILLDALVDEHDAHAEQVLATPLRRMRDIAKEAVSEDQAASEAVSCRPLRAVPRRSSSPRTLPSNSTRRGSRSAAA
jgi:hypothetical protein